MENGRRVLKMFGGYAFFSIADAEQCITELGKADEWEIFGLKTTADNTRIVDGEHWHVLIESAEIFLLNEEG